MVKANPLRYNQGVMPADADEVYALTRCGQVLEGKASAFNWSMDGHAADIVRYRITKFKPTEKNGMPTMMLHESDESDEIRAMRVEPETAPVKTEPRSWQVAGYERLAKVLKTAVDIANKPQKPNLRQQILNDLAGTTPVNHLALAIAEIQIADDHSREESIDSVRYHAALAIRAISELCLQLDFGVPSTEGYLKVAEEAYDQAARGKGAERHANDKAFHEQPMQTISQLLKSPSGMAFQAIKKLKEGSHMAESARTRREYLGAINYIVGIVIYTEDKCR